MTSSRLTSVAADMRAKAKAAEFTAPSPWHVDGFEICTDDQEPIETLSVITSGLHWHEAAEQRAYVAAMHPDVGSAAAHLLEVIAADVGTSSLAFHAALALCDAYEGSVDMRAKGES